MERELAITNHEGLCWKCLQSYDCSNINVINIHELGYGSQFDGDQELHLCNDCYQESIKNNPKLWNLETKQVSKYMSKYIYEDEMVDYIDQLPIQGRQFVENEFNPKVYLEMEPQDWLDKELGVLSKEKRIDYGFELQEEDVDLEYAEYLIYKAKVDEYEKKHKNIQNI
jgi:hypothetical protein